MATGEVLGLPPGSGGPHAFALLPPPALLVVGKSRWAELTCCYFSSRLVYPLRNAISPPSHFLKPPNAKEKKKLTSQRRRGLRTHIPIRLLPRPCTRQCRGRINWRPILCVNPRRRPNHGSGCFGWGRFHFDGERPTERFVGYVFGWDGTPVCGWVGFVDYAG